MQLERVIDSQMHNTAQEQEALKLYPNRTVKRMTVMTRTMTTTAVTRLRSVYIVRQCSAVSRSVSQSLSAALNYEWPISEPIELAACYPLSINLIPRKLSCHLSSVGGGKSLPHLHPPPPFPLVEFIHLIEFLSLRANGRIG